MALEDVLNIAESIGFGREEVSKKIQERYATYVRKGWLGRLRVLQEATGIKPKLSEDVIQKEYATYVREGRLGRLRDLQEATGIKPSKEVYREFIKSLYDSS